MDSLIKIIRLIPLIIFLNCNPKHEHEFSGTALSYKAYQNGIIANEGFIRCRNYVDAWLNHADTKTGLIPRNINESNDFWNAKDAAADNYPFMVLTSFFVDQELFQGKMRNMLFIERQLTSRINSLPDTYSFSKEDFLNESINKDEVIFGTSEYIKDGLLPLTEWLGQSPWLDRMVEMIYDLKEEINVAGDVGVRGYGKVPREEVNGELLQVLSRVYWLTQDESLLDWAISIGDFYLLGNHHPTRDMEYLRLRDHGCELISGLCELYITCQYARKSKKEEYQVPLYEMLDRILEVGRNEDGLFYDAVNPQTGEVIESRLADTWGYTLNGFYGVYMIDGPEEYKGAVLKVFSNLHKYANQDWEGNADGYADAIESALNLYNRIQDQQVANWIDSEIKVMWDMQQDNGIIEGWHGDGNFARTTIMYNLWKSKGLYLQPWREDIELGAEMKGDTLLISLKSESPWEGSLFFDQERHKTNLNLPMDWPRINQFPEWYTVEPDRSYQVLDPGSENSKKYLGGQLLDGIPITLDDSTTMVVF